MSLRRFSHRDKEHLAVAAAQAAAARLLAGRPLRTTTRPKLKGRKTETGTRIQAHTTVSPPQTSPPLCIRAIILNNPPALISPPVPQMALCTAVNTSPVSTPPMCTTTWKMKQSGRRVQSERHVSVCGQGGGRGECVRAHRYATSMWSGRRVKEGRKTPRQEQTVGSCVGVRVHVITFVRLYSPARQSARRLPARHNPARARAPRS